MAAATAAAAKGKAAKGKEEGEDKKKKLTRAEVLQEFFGKVNEKYGSGTIGIAEEMEALSVPRLPTGIFAMDLAMGGGVPMRRVTMFYGHKSSGKTSAALRAVAFAQRLCRRCDLPADWDIIENEPDPKTGEITVTRKGYCPRCKEKFERMQCVWIDAEGAFDIGWAKHLGVWTDDLFISRPESAEQTVDVVDNLLRTRAVDLLVLDSIAALVPMDEIEQSAEKWQQGLQARLVNKLMRKITAAMNEVGRAEGAAPTIILLNQLRTKIGVMFGSPDTLPGGLGQGFTTSVEVKCWAGQVILDKEEGKEEEKAASLAQPLFQKLNFKVTKNKTASPGMEAEYQVALVDTETAKKGEVVDEELVYALAVKFGFLTPHAEKKTKLLYPGLPADLAEEDGFQKSQIVKLWMGRRDVFATMKANITAVYRAA